MMTFAAFSSILTLTRSSAAVVYYPGAVETG